MHERKERNHGTIGDLALARERDTEIASAPMWHRLLLIGLMGCAPALAVAKNYTSLASDYQVGLGVAFGTRGISAPRNNVNVDMTPVFESGNPREYERSIESFRASLTKTQIDGGQTKFSLLLAPLEMPEQYLQGLVPVGWVGPFGLWAPASLPADIVQGLEQTLVRMNGTGLMRFQKVDLPLTTGGASDMLAKAQAARSAEEAAAPVRAPVPVNTVGPQIKGYDPKQADRPTRSDQPPPLKHIDWKAGGYGTGLCTWPDDNMNLRREREAREAKAAAAKKPRLTMADYAKKAAQEKADFAVRKAQAAADSKQVLNWLKGDRNANDKAARLSWEKRGEYIRGQIARRDAVTNGNSFSDGTWVKIPLRNHTDVAMEVTIKYRAYNKKTGTQIGFTSRTTQLLAMASEDVVLFGHEPDWQVEDNVTLTWTALSFEYTNKILVF